MEKPRTKCWSVVQSRRCCSQVHAAGLRPRVAGDAMAHGVGGSQRAPTGCALCETEAVRHPRHPRVQGQADSRHLGTKERLGSALCVSRVLCITATRRSGSASSCLLGSRVERYIGCAPCSTHGCTGVQSAIIGPRRELGNPGFCNLGIMLQPRSVSGQAGMAPGRACPLCSVSLSQQCDIQEFHNTVSIPIL